MVPPRRSKHVCVCVQNSQNIDGFRQSNLQGILAHKTQLEL